MIYQIIQK